MTMSKNEFDLSDMPISASFSDEELDVMAQLDADQASLKRSLPMFFTPRGNVVKRGTFRVSSKNFRYINSTIDTVNKAWGVSIVAVTPDWEIRLSPTMSDGLRSNGLVAALILAGWKLDIA